MSERPRHPRAKRMVSMTVRGVTVVPLSVKVPAWLLARARTQAFTEGITLQEWVTAAVVEELARRRTLGV